MNMTPSKFHALKKWIYSNIHLCQNMRMSKLLYPIGAELFRFTSYSEWVSDSKYIYKGLGVAVSQVIMFDSRFRKCESELDFKRAQDEQAFPIVAYRTASPAKAMRCAC